MPNVVCHASDIIEHPLSSRTGSFVSHKVGRRQMIAGTDCGLASRIGGPEICWVKLRPLGEGAREATCVPFG